MTYAKGFYEAQKGADMTFSDKAKEILLDAEFRNAVGDNRFDEPVAALTAAHEEALIEELEGLKPELYWVASPDDTSVISLETINNRIAELKKGQER